MSSDVADYLRELVSRVGAILGDELVGVYAGGSLALGAYDPARSDVDVAVVCLDALTRAKKDELVAAVRHESLPCPARGLELVVYTERTARSGTSAPAYELNLNSGPRMQFHVSPSPGGEPDHWFAVDRALLREHGLALFGPPPLTLFASIPRSELRRRLVEVVRWHEDAGVAGAADAVLTACRAWRVTTEGVWSSKAAAGAWASRRAEDAELVEDALAARAQGRALDAARAGLFVASVRRLLERNAAEEAPSSHS